MVRLGFSKQFLGVVVSARVAFSERSWPYVVAMVIPWIICQGQRCISRMRPLASYGRSLSSYYRFLSDGKFRLEIFRQCLFQLIVKTFRPERILIVVDDTLCAKWGRHIFGTSSFFDHVARPRPGFIWGHNWVVLALVVTIAGVPVALPFWVELYRSDATCRRGEFRTRLQMVTDALKVVRTWTLLPIEAVADGAYNNEGLLRPLGELGIALTSRLRQDAKLRDEVPDLGPFDPPRRGRRPKYGPPLPALSTLAKSRRGWQLIRVPMYRTIVTLKVRSIVAWWPASAKKVRLVITKDPRRNRRVAFLTSTDLSKTPEEIITTFAKRWSIEQLFADVKLHLGLDTAEVRKPNSVIRHAALCFALATWIHVWHELTQRRACRKRSEKVAEHAVSFRHKFQGLRTYLAKHAIFSSQPRPGRSARNCDALADLFARALTAA